MMPDLPDHHCQQSKKNYSAGTRIVAVCRGKEPLKQFLCKADEIPVEDCSEKKHLPAAKSFVGTNKTPNLIQILFSQDSGRSSSILILVPTDHLPF